MNVIRDGFVRRARSSSAARPTCTRSRDSSSANGSASVILSPSSARSRMDRTLLGPVPDFSLAPACSDSTLKADPALFCRVDRSFQTAARAEPARPEVDIASDVSCGHSLPDEAKLGHRVQLAGLDRSLEERDEAFSLPLRE